MHKFDKIFIFSSNICSQCSFDSMFICMTLIPNANISVFIRYILSIGNNCKAVAHISPLNVSKR